MALEYIRFSWFSKFATHIKKVSLFRESGCTIWSAVVRPGENLSVSVYFSVLNHINDVTWLYFKFKLLVKIPVSKNSNNILSSEVQTIILIL